MTNPTDTMPVVAMTEQRAERMNRQIDRKFIGFNGIEVLQTDDQVSIVSRIHRPQSAVTAESGNPVKCVQIVTIGSTSFAVRDIKDDGTVDPAQTPYTVYAYTRDENFNVGVAPLSACRPTPIVAKTLLIWQQSIRVGTQMITDWWTVDVFYKVC